MVTPDYTKETQEKQNSNTNGAGAKHGAAVIARLIACQEVDQGHLTILVDPWDGIAQALNGCPLNRDQRSDKFQKVTSVLEDAALIREAVFAVDPERVDLDTLLSDASGMGGILSAYELLTTDYPEPVWAIPEYLPVGLSIFAGKAKLGKSWLALQMAQSIAHGGRLFDLHINRGSVLYMALEDNPRRLQERMKKQGWQKSEELRADFLPIGEFEGRIGDLRNGGAENVGRLIEFRKYKLVVIDTFSRAIGGKQNEAESMTRWLKPLHELSLKKGCSIMLIDHHNKAVGSSEDAINDVLGSTAKGAIADTIWGFYRKRGTSEARLRMTGRDIEEKTLALRFDGLTGSWQSEGDINELKITEHRRSILEALEALGTCKLKEISEAIGGDTSNTLKRLNDMVGAGLIIRSKVGRGVFFDLA